MTPSSSAVPVRPRASPWWRAQREIIRQFVRDGAAGAPPGAALKTDCFDEASGPHYHAADVRPGFTALAIDVDEAIASRARARLRADGAAVAVAVADVRHLPFATGSLSLVISLSTLDHLDAETEISRSLAECFRALRPGGRLLLTLDNPLNPEVALRAALPRALVARLRADAFPLGVTVGARRGRRLLERAGFAVERQGYLVHAPRYPMIRMLGWLERRGRGRGPERLVTALEALARWPCRSITGHYAAWVAVKPPSR